MAPPHTSASWMLAALLVLVCSSACAGARLDAETAAEAATTPWVIGGDNSNYSHVQAPDAGRGGGRGRGRGYFTGRGGGRFVVRGGDGRFVVRGGRGRGAFLGTFGRGRGSGGEFTRFGRGGASGREASAGGVGDSEGEGTGVRSHLQAECVNLKAISCDLDQDCQPVHCTTTDEHAATEGEQNETEYAAKLLQGVVDSWMASEGNGCRIRESIVDGPGACGIELFPLTAE